MVSVGEVKAGIVSYTYETGLYNGHRTLNGSIIPQDAQERINSFRYYKIEEDLKRIGEDIDALRGKGADIVIAYLHWGNEYQRKASQADRSIAQAVAEAGADIILHRTRTSCRKSKKFISSAVAAEERVTDEDAMRRSDEVKGADPMQKPSRVLPGQLHPNQRRRRSTTATEQGMIASVDLCTMWIPGSSKRQNIVYSHVGEITAPGGRTRYAIVPLVGDYLSNPAGRLGEAGLRAPPT